ncbi:MAG: hypothetical protein BVN35_21280 [Proteobacteria bacterium ST_bin11]|nr:MAG: hypothetical protein BVN35_21280 [Proteobacteria bacterium ST_bin11]
MNTFSTATPTELSRTFSSAQNRQDDGDDWSAYLGLTKGKLTWKDLHNKPLSVIVGEAGIGKTVEFELEAQRLRSAGNTAFFVALNLLVDLESWERALAESFDEYEHWKVSTGTAYFLLDAVDEARLTGQTAFEQALSVVSWALRGNMSRVHFVISSRPTDWSIESVRVAVNKYLGRPIAAALSALEETQTSEIGSGGTTLDVIRLPTMEVIEPLVVSIDPLSISEAKRLAEAFGVLDAKAFWDTVSDGGYAFMATRPLDLGWMVRLWNEKRSLGTYRELIEFNIENRLTEMNPSYRAAGAVLSQDQLRRGAEELAAAAELSGRAYIATESAPTVRADEVAPSSVLSGWKPNEIARLLSAAVFDEATFGRVRFHHRIIRAYLAACWVNRQLAIGVPFHRMLTLFASSPFGTVVLIPNRRWALCWLATINVAAREWLTQYFPEMLLFDGDPEAWDSLSADRAFMGYVNRLKNGLGTDWYNDISEFRRVGRRLSPGLVAGILVTPDLSTQVTSALFPIIKHGHLADCAEAVFGIYRNTVASHRERRYALTVLKTIATPEQRIAIKDDLVSGLLTTNELIASALPAADWQSLSVEQLVAIFGATQSEGSYGASPMSRTLKDDMLPETNAVSAEALLRAVLEALPKPEQGKRFARFPDSDQPERAWLLDVLPDCFERLLTLLPRTHTNYPEACMEAAERLEALRDTGFTNREEFSRIHSIVANHPGLRWQIALEIAQSENITHSTSRLVWGMDCLVSFAADDVPQLIVRANDGVTNIDLRNIWFTVGMDVIFRGLRGRERTDALASLVSGTDNEARTTCIATQRTNWIDGAKHRREWKSKEIARKRGLQAQHEVNRLQLLSNVEHIRDASHKGRLHWLINYSYNQSGRNSLTHVDYGLIARDFDQTVADALAAGLKVEWATTEDPNPADYSDGTVPWDALAALAGLHTLLDEGMEIASLPDVDAGRAAKLAVWELNGPDWFEPLVTAHPPAVSESLKSCIESEAQLATDTHGLRRCLEMALRCSADVGAALLAPLTPMITDGRISHPKTLKDVVKALRAGGLIASDVLTDLCRAKVVASISPQGLVGEIHWLRTWLEEDPASAWAWFEDYVANSPTVAGELVNSFARMANDCRWFKQPANVAAIDVLLRLHRLLTQHQPSPDTQVSEENQGVFEHVVLELRSKIPNLLTQTRGLAAHRALIELETAEISPNTKQWLGDRIMEHAALEALQTSQIDPRNLYNISSPFVTDPESEAQLFKQVIARLEEIRKGTEEGPFSDRGLFSPNIPEKHLQNWLAARFRETQNRRFTVTREEEVDKNKEPDIQLGCPQGKVCVEIKPLSREHSYSANSLTDTLRTQIVSQYLKGFNSAHGVLVLFRLDDKAWDIPGGEKSKPFSALVEYMQAQATIIMAESSGVNALTVFGIDCVA